MSLYENGQRLLHLVSVFAKVLMGARCFFKDDLSHIFTHSISLGYALTLCKALGFTDGNHNLVPKEHSGRSRHMNESVTEAITRVGRSESHIGKDIPHVQIQKRTSADAQN